MYYNPYGYQFGNYQPQQNYQGYQQSNYQQYQAPVNFQPVDSFEAAKAKDVDMTGQAKYYPNINGTEIYMKQLQADGTCPTVVYRRIEPQIEPKEDPFAKVMAELETIKSMIS